jgi:hypothetical protein
MERYRIQPLHTAIDDCTPAGVVPTEPRSYRDPRYRSWEDQAADDAGVKRWGEI